MKLGITGLAGAGKTTIFEALTGNFSETVNKNEDRVGTVKVPDKRVDILSEMYKPAKTIFAQVEYFLPGSGRQEERGEFWNLVRDCDALLHVIRNFKEYGAKSPTPYKDFTALQQEMIFSDLLTVEKRLERVEQERKRGRKINNEELSILNECKKILESEQILRTDKEIRESMLLKGFSFLTVKPTIPLFNNEDGDDLSPETDDILSNPVFEQSAVMQGKIEQEIASMPAEEAESFLKEFDIKAPGKDIVIEKSYKIMGLISFFTVGKDEVRAWTIPKDSCALDAAGAIHSDLKKGFIRAEVVSFDDLIEAGSFVQAKKQAAVRLEGKIYIVQDGDIINIRFNV